MTYRADRAYWSTPFSRWQETFARLYSLEFAASTTRRKIARLGIDGKALGHGVLGFSVLQAHSFYGLPWVAARAVIELVEELVQRGGGFGLFVGCAAGEDSTMAVVVEVSIAADRNETGRSVEASPRTGHGQAGGDGSSTRHLKFAANSRPRLSAFFFMMPRPNLPSLPTTVASDE